MVDTFDSALSRRSFLAGTAALLAAGAGPARGQTQAAEEAPNRRPRARGKFDLDRFVEDARQANTEAESQRAVQEVLARATSDPGAVAAALGEPKGAGAQTLYKDEGFTILNVIWAPLMVLLPHNHNMWALIGVYTGREDNIFWRRVAGSRIEASGAQALSQGDVAALPVDVIHSVTNPIERLTGAIHIYGGPFFDIPRSEWDAETLVERPFDLEKNLRLFREANERFELG